jgi:hypothetical protein
MPNEKDPKATINPRTSVPSTPVIVSGIGSRDHSAPGTPLPQLGKSRGLNFKELDDALAVLAENDSDGINIPRLLEVDGQEKMPTSNNLYDAVIKGNYNDVVHFMEKGEDPNLIPEGHEFPALYRSLHNNSDDITELLVGSGARLSEEFMDRMSQNAPARFFKYDMILAGLSVVNGGSSVISDVVNVTPNHSMDTKKILENAEQIASGRLTENKFDRRLFL